MNTATTKLYDYIEQGDCMDLMQKIPDQSVDLIVTDPPYSTPIMTGFGRQLVWRL